MSKKPNREGKQARKRRQARRNWKRDWKPKGEVQSKQKNHSGSYGK